MSDKKAPPKGTTYEIVVHLFQTGSTDEIGNDAVIISAFADVRALRTAIVDKFPETLKGREASKLVVKPTLHGAPLDPDADLWEVQFERNKKGKLQAHVDVPPKPKPEGVAVGQKRRRLDDSLKIVVGVPESTSLSIEGKVATFSAVQLANVGVKPSKDFFHLYLRPSALAQLEFLEKSKISLIRGPPGCGKSLVAWVFALRTAIQGGKKVLWCHYSKDDYSACWITQDRIFPVGLEEDELADASADVLILDGLTKDHKIGVGMSWKCIKANRKLCIVTSQRCENLDFKYRFERGIETLDVPSWTKEEYVEAVRHEAIFKQVQPNLATTQAEEEEVSWEEQLDDK